MNNDVPLICDDPPGARYIITTDRHLTPQQINDLRARWEEAAKSAGVEAYVLGPGMDIKVLPGRYEWPDAEFCAA